MERSEAIERIKARYDKWALDNEDLEALRTLIPEEYKETEDERIRKHIVKFIDEQYPTHGNLKEEKDKMLAYLEKLKELKSLNLSSASEWLREHVCSYINSEYNEFHKCVEYDGSIDKEKLINDFEEAMQKEQKPIEDVIKNITKNKEAATNFLKSAGIMDDNGELAEMYRSEQKPAEWSEEDEQTFIKSVETLEYLGKFELANWLKDHKNQFLKPQNTWKPSKEEMGALAEAMERNDKIGYLLHQLHEELKHNYKL